MYLEFIHSQAKKNTKNYIKKTKSKRIHFTGSRYFKSDKPITTKKSLHKIHIIGITCENRNLF